MKDFEGLSITICFAGALLAGCNRPRDRDTATGSKGDPSFGSQSQPNSAKQPEPTPTAATYLSAARQLLATGEGYATYSSTDKDGTIDRLVYCTSRQCKVAGFTDEQGKVGETFAGQDRGPNTPRGWFADTERGPWRTRRSLDAQRRRDYGNDFRDDGHLS